MVKLLDDGSLVIPGEKAAHASLDALVAFHQQKPIGPHEELLTQPCGQVRVGPPRTWGALPLPLWRWAASLNAALPVPVSRPWCHH